MALLLNNQKISLQEQFMAVVKSMVATSCPLPDEFQLFYRVMLHRDRYGEVASIKPFLTESAAKLDCGEDEEWERKHDSDIKYSVVDSSHHVNTYNFHSVYPEDEDPELQRAAVEEDYIPKKRTLHEIDVDIQQKV